MKSKQSVIFGLLLLTLPAAVEAQITPTYTTNADGVSLTLALYTGGPYPDAVIPDSANGLPVTGIRDGAFQSCLYLRSVTIGNYVTNIGAGAFEGCSYLVAIIAGAQNPVFSSLNGVLFNKSQTVLVAFPQGLIYCTIPDSVTTIGAGAFSNCVNLAFLTMGNSVTAIGDSAFYGCFGLTSLAIPDSVTTIGNSAFYDCYGLTNMTMGNSVTNIGEEAFQYCFGLTNVVIPNGVTTIGSNTFSFCSGLTRVRIPSGVTNIGEGAFQYCGNLTNLIIGSGVSSIGGSAFLNCGSLESVFFLGNPPATGARAFDKEAYYITCYYLPGATGWSSDFLNHPVLQWNPVIETGGTNFGVRDNQFGFNIAGAVDIPIVVEACTNLANPVWTPVQSITLTNGLFYFSEPFQAKSSGRFYCIGMP